MTLKATSARTRSFSSSCGDGEQRASAVRPESSHLWAPAWRAADDLQNLGAAEPQAALPIPASCAEGVGEASTGLERVKLPVLQSGPEQLCC